MVANADRDAGQRVGCNRTSSLRGHCGWIEVDGLGRRRRGVGGCGNGDFDRVTLFAAFDCGSEGVLEELGKDVLEMCGYVGEAGVGLAVDGDGGPDAVFQLADFRDEGFALADCFGGAERGVDYADGGGRAVLGVGVVVVVAVRLRGEVESDVLLGNQPRPDPGP